jgi:hypothetical protein
VRLYINAFIPNFGPISIMNFEMLLDREVYGFKYCVFDPYKTSNAFFEAYFGNLTRREDLRKNIIFFSEINDAIFNIAYLFDNVGNRSIQLSTKAASITSS